MPGNGRGASAPRPQMLSDVPRPCPRGFEGVAGRGKAPSGPRVPGWRVLLSGEPYTLASPPWSSFPYPLLFCWFLSPSSATPTCRTRNTLNAAYSIDNSPRHSFEAVVARIPVILLRSASQRLLDLRFAAPALSSHSKQDHRNRQACHLPYLLESRTTQQPRDRSPAAPPLMDQPPHVDVEGQSRAGHKAPQPNHVLSTNFLQICPPHLLHYSPIMHRTLPRTFLRQLVIPTM